MRTDATSTDANSPSRPEAAEAGGRSARPGFLLAIGGLLAVAVVAAGAVDWQREKKAAARTSTTTAELLAGLERDKQRLTEEIRNLRAENEAGLAAVEQDYAARLAAAEAIAASAAQGGAAAELEAARAALAQLQREHEQALARERAAGEERLLVLRGGYEADLARLREALDAAAAGEWFVASPAPPVTAEPAAPAAPQTDAASSTREPQPPPGFDLHGWARSEEVALALGPFLEPGYAQLDNTFGEERLPFSLEQLRATGALADDESGWRTMHRIASSRRDVARTRWASEPGVDATERIRRAQRLLRDLGPTLVECGLLRP